nr:uncharacterized protein LOC129472067 isoform X2 [Symphalangus syndactylus]
MTPRRRPRPRAAAGAAAPARAAREARRWRCRERAVGAAARGRGGAGRTFPCVARMAAQGVGPGPGSAAPPGLEAARQKLALRRKKVLSTEEMELYELAQAAGGAIDPDVFKILVDLLKLNVAPLAVFQMLKSMCAGQRLASEPQDPAAVSLPTSSVPETRESPGQCHTDTMCWSHGHTPALSRLARLTPELGHFPGFTREKQRQHCPRGSIGPGGTQQPRRIQPEDATPAQRYQAAQGGRAWEEPYAGQHLGWGRDLSHLCPQQRLRVISFS